jgi:hypothetical protein
MLKVLDHSDNGTHINKMLLGVKTMVATLKRMLRMKVYQAVTIAASSQDVSRN